MQLETNGCHCVLFFIRGKLNFVIAGVQAKQGWWMIFHGKNFDI
jgi:hypothetical protein